MLSRLAPRMRFFDRIRFGLLAILARRRMDAEIDEELAFHIDAYVADEVKRGVPEAAARREALRRFGGVRRTKEEVREAQGLAFWSALRQDTVYALHSLRRSPGFSAMVAITLGLGIGANAAMFGIVDRLMLRGPAHVERPGELRRLYVKTPDGSGGHRTSQVHQYPLLAAVRDQASAFSGVAGYTSSRIRLADGLDAPFAAVHLVTADYWAVLGVRPLLGRFFSPDEDRPPRGEDVVVLGHGFWQRQHGGERAVLGRQIRLGARQFTVIGVAPSGFTGPEWGEVDAWIPMSTRGATLRADWPDSWTSWFVRIVGRLQPDATEELAAAQTTALLRANYAGWDAAAVREAEALARPISSNADGVEPAELGVARLLYGVAIVMGLIVAANVANLLLARAVRRRRELAIRVALGAGRRRLASMLLSEAAVLAVLGGVLGVAVAYWGGQLARATLFPDVAWDTHPADLRVFRYTLVSVGVTALLIGLLPAIRASGAELREAFSSGGKQSGQGGGEQHRQWRMALQAGQVALSVVLLFVAGLFVRSLVDVRTLDLGIQPERVVVASVGFPPASAAEQAAAGPFGALDRQRWLSVLERVSGAPGVERAAVAIGSPFESWFRVSLAVPGRDSVLPWDASGPFINAVTPGYFETVGTPLRRGRLFGAGDREGSERVVIVNETMARRLWPGEDAIGKCLLVGGLDAPCAHVVGIVADARQSRLREDPIMQYYLPLGQERQISGGSLLVRPSNDPESFAPVLRRALVEAVPAAQSLTVELMARRLDPQIRPWRVGARMFGVFGVLALVVAAVGLFSVVSYLVSQRQHELGVRIAIGARSADIVRLVLSRSLITTLLGVVVGGAIALAFAPLLQPYLFENPARDGALVGLVALSLIATALAASAAPCVRACRVDPVVALRAD